MRLHIFVLACIALLAIGCTSSKKVITLEMPLTPQASVDPADIARCLEQYKGYDGVILTYENSIEHSGSKDDTKRGFFSQFGLLGSLANYGKDWLYSNTYKDEYIILNPEATSLTTYSLGYKPSKFYIQVTYPNGDVKLYKFADMTKTTDPDGDTDYRIAFPNVTPGTVVQVGYQDDYRASYYMPPLEEYFPLQFNIPCEKLTASYAIPEWWTVNTKQIAPKVGIPLSSTNDSLAKKIILTYKAENVPAIKDEPFSPPFKQVAKYLNIMVTHFMMMGISDDRGESWDKFSEQFRKYVLKKGDKRSKKMEAVVDSLTNMDDSAMTKINAILSYIHKNIEPSYMDDNDGNPGKTLDKKKGTYYDINNLAYAMLTYAGITCNFVIVHDAWDGYFDPMYVSPSQIYMPALQVNLGDRELAVFPTLKYLPAPMIPSRYQGQDAIVMNEGELFRFWNVPNDSSGTKYATNYKLHIDTSGTVKVRMDRVIDGIGSYYRRRDFETYSYETKLDSLRAGFKLAGEEYTVDSVSIQNDTDYQSPLIERFDLTLNNMVTQTPDEIIIQKTDLFTFGNDELTENFEQRTNDIYIPYNAHYSRTLDYVLPAGWVAASLPPADTIQTELGSLASEWTTTAEGIRATQSVTLKQSFHPKEKYADLLALLGKETKATVPALVLKRAQ